MGWFKERKCIFFVNSRHQQIIHAIADDKKKKLIIKKNKFKVISTA